MTIRYVVWYTISRSRKNYITRLVKTYQGLLARFLISKGGVYWNGGDSPEGGYIPGTPDEDDYKTLSNEILKEFVYKDNLPSEFEIGHILQNFTREDRSGIYYYIHDKDFTKLAKALRKLIEGKK